MDKTERGVFLSIVLMVAVFAVFGTVLRLPGETVEPTPTVTARVITTVEPRTFDLDDVDMLDTPNSTCFSQVGYDSFFDVLVVEFRDSGATYTYTDFSSDEWRSFINADSLGKYFNANIKDEYAYEKIA